VHTLDDSLDTVRLTPAFGDPHAAWRARNDAGVSLALEGRWPEALEAFSDALSDAPCFAEAPDVHALLHGNRAQAHFHVGELQLAVESAERALAARLVCGDADDAPVARMRADLGVYLAACGSITDAEQSLAASRYALESRFGEDDLRLASVLENQARIQLLAHRPEAAEPLLLRLHALLGEQNMPTDMLSPLFDAVRRARAPEQVPEHAESATADAFDDFDVFPSETNEMADPAPAVEASDALEVDESLEDDLLVFDTIVEDVAASDLLDDAFEMIDAEDLPPMRSPSADAIRSAGLIEPGAHATPQEAIRRTHPLGFEIQYGIPQDQLLGGDAA
jgi:tetratricopeptide (TPR) repeat protein